jgi:hypothetical protein
VDELFCSVDKGLRKDISNHYFAEDFLEARLFALSALKILSLNESSDRKEYGLRFFLYLTS